jgi:hypothetical protein
MKRLNDNQPNWQAQYSQLQAQFSRYTKPEHYNPEKIQELKGRIEGPKGEKRTPGTISDEWELPPRCN